MAEDKKKFNKQDYDNNYIRKKYDRINFVMPKGTKNRITEAAEVRKLKVSEFLRLAIEQELERTEQLKETNEAQE
jgi:hypothetical protein